MITVVGHAGDRARPVFGPVEMPDLVADLSEITVDTGDGGTPGRVYPVLYHVRKRTFRVGADGRPVLELTLARDEPTTWRLMLIVLGQMPLSTARPLIGLTVLAVSVGLFFAGWWLVDHRFELLGYGLRHAPVLLAALALAACFRAGFRRRSELAQTLFGMVGVVLMIAVYAAMRWALPQLAGAAETFGFVDVDVDYRAFGELSWERRDALLLLVAPWVPTVVILMNALGFKILPALIEKNVKAKGK